MSDFKIENFCFQIHVNFDYQSIYKTFMCGFDFQF